MGDGSDGSAEPGPTDNGDQMTAVGVSLFLLGIFCLPFVTHWREARRLGDVFFPLWLVAGRQIAEIVPRLAYVGLHPDDIEARVRAHPSITDMDATILWFGVVYALGFIALLLGYSSGLGKAAASRLPLDTRQFTSRRYTIAALGSLALALAIWAFGMHRRGGILAAVLTMGLKEVTGLQTQLVGGAYYNACLFFFTSAFIMAIYAQKDSIRTSTKTLVALVGAVAVLGYWSWGGRFQVFVGGAIGFLTWHYGVRRFRRFPTAMVSVALGASVLFSMVTIAFRGSGVGAARYLDDPSSFARDVLASAPAATKRFSPLDRYLLVVGYFTADKVWLGRSYLGLLTAPIPSAWWQDKPGGDDGLYLESIASGMDVTPPMPAWKTIKSSWPPLTFGIGYMNFWVPGVVAGMFLLGACYRAAYDNMRRNSFSIHSVGLYGLTLLVLGFSNLEIILYLTRLAVFTIAYLLFLSLPDLLSRRTARATGLSCMGAVGRPGDAVDTNGGCSELAPRGARRLEHGA